MLHEEVKQLCIDELNSLSKYDCSDIDRIQLFNEICQKIESSYNIEGLQIERTTRGSNDCIIYRFYGYNNAICSAGFLYNADTFDDDLANAICDIVDGNEAIKIINEAIDECRDKSGDTTIVHYIWGKGPYCKVYDWDYESINFKVSNKSLKSILDNYRDGATSFSIEVNKALSKDRITKENILKIITNFNNFYFNKSIEAEIWDKRLINHLAGCFVNRNEAIDICCKQPVNSLINLRVAEIINQLGTFIALANWRVDLKNKDISISLVGDKVIDTDNAEFISNYNICARIEQIISLSDDEKSKIFKD